MYKNNLNNEIKRPLKMPQFAPNVPKTSNYNTIHKSQFLKTTFHDKKHAQQSLIRNFYIAVV